MDPTDQISKILTELIALPSSFPPGDTEAISAYTAKRLKKAGYQTEIYSRCPPIANVVASMGSGAPSIVFNAHADTVAIGDDAEWETEPFSATTIDDRVYGLGAGNCKGAMAVQIWLAEEIARRGGPDCGEVVFTFVGDEENLGPNGLCYLRDEGIIKPDVLICGAQTQLQAIFEERGVIWVEVTATGNSAHAGEPQNGDNAINRMVRLINQLESKLSPVLAKRRRGELCSTMNIGIIKGGINTNAVPSKCRIEIDRRLLPEELIEEAVSEIEVALLGAEEPRDTWSVNLLTGTKGFSSPTDAPSVSAFKKAITNFTGEPTVDLVAIGASDARYFAEDGIVAMTFGPGRAEDGHKPNEFVSAKELGKAALIQLSVVSEVLGLGSKGQG
ncbi:MAG: M20 family metallopeptidase [Alphaproteobacteria bacterium]